MFQDLAKKSLQKGEKSYDFMLKAMNFLPIDFVATESQEDKIRECQCSISKD